MRFTPVLGALALVALVACGASAPSTLAGGTAQAGAATLDELEEQAVALTEGLTAALTAAGASPQEALANLNAYIRANVDEMNAVAQAFARRIAAASEAEQYAQLAAWNDSLGPATFAWRDAYFGFLSEHADLTDELEAIVAPLGEQRAPYRRPE